MLMTKHLQLNSMITTTITTIKMQVELKRISSQTDLEAIRELYISAFPANERREFDDLKQLSVGDDCLIFKILTESGTFAGFCILWEFPNFIFIEHFAVKPELRGLGIGEKTLAAIKTGFSKTVILETELPADEISQRRIRFYERNGLHKLSRTYFQPSYGGNKPQIELKLMSSNVDFQTEELDSFIRSIHKKVFGIA